MVGSGTPPNSAGVAHLYIFPAKQQSKSTMKHNPAIPAVDNAEDGVNILTFLQLAVDHYPRLVAFSFTMLFPRSENQADNWALILRFHTEAWLQMGEYRKMGDVMLSGEKRLR
ncbi:TPA: hypothetical protein MYU63_004133 [Citrobacter amalonaticus]|uniref:hypothetical protein n=1 Tax=Enterobacteriaceae TaxID=543 RepID=UPI0032202DC4|nr:hypothetical protein [Citrobacter amalonaticus]